MRLTMLRSSCQNGRTCPNINVTDRATLVVQGYTTNMTADDDVSVIVAIPRTLLPEVDDGSPAISLVGDEMLHVTGCRVTDPEALVELALPVGEDAVEIPLAAAPEEVTSHA